MKYKNKHLITKIEPSAYGWYKNSCIQYSEHNNKEYIMVEFYYNSPLKNRFGRMHPDTFDKSFGYLKEIIL